MQAVKILLTGYPGCGKTTLIRKVIAQIPGPLAGFYTQEIRSGGRRVGFELLTLDGRRGVLAHVDIRSGYRVGKYRVDLDSLDNLAVPSLYQGIAEDSLVVVDEIGPMEILSPQFRQAVLAVLDSSVRTLGSIVMRSTPFTDEIKAHPNVELITVQPANRDRLAADIIKQIQVTQND